MLSKRFIAGGAVVLAVGLLPSPARAADEPATVTVNLKAGQATVPATALGVNDAVWDAQLGTSAVSGLLSQAGVGTMRYPGGSYGDIYHWKDNTAPGGYVAPGTDFDTFMGSVKTVGAQPMIIANYGTGTPEEAADWVRYANVEKGYGAKYWTIGNENYGNGHYGTAWEADDHADKSPAAYANGVVAYAKAMKAVDPTVKIGAVLTMPGNWPDGLVGSGDAGTWNQVVLKIAGPSIDFADVHWYPGGGTVPDALAKTDQIDDALYLLHQQTSLPISLTETNAGVGQNTQPGALFLADAYAGMLENGVFTVDWWDVHNGIGTPSTVLGQTDYNDFGILSSGNCTADNSVCEPAMNTPFAPYYALKLMHEFAHPGDQLVKATSTDPLVSAHAARRPDGTIALLVVNKSDHAVPMPGYAGAAVSTFANGDAQVSDGVFAGTLPAYSIQVLTLAKKSVTGPDAPGTPKASAVTDHSATISWTGTGGTKYEVYDQNGGELGETTGTSLTVGNLKPGTRYTVNVLARDNGGKLSAASDPVTFTTGAPATSTCAVHFSDDNDWGNGFVASVNVTGQAPQDWTLTFDWPTGRQSVSSGWNATWTQTGRSVKAVGTGALPAGIGFVASYDGPNILPTVFRLNGTVCSAG